MSKLNPWQGKGNGGGSGTVKWELENVPPEDIVRLPQFQMRTRVNSAIVHRYREAMKARVSFPPVRLALVEGTRYLIDGAHRLGAFNSLPKQVRPKTVRAEVGRFYTLEAAAWEAALANLTHGLQLSTREMRNVFRAYVNAGENREIIGKHFKSYRTIAKDIGGPSVQTIYNWMAQDYPAIAAAMAEQEDPTQAPRKPRSAKTPNEANLEVALELLERLKGHAGALTEEASQEQLGTALMNLATTLKGAAGESDR